MFIEVVYALPDRQEVVSLQLPEGATVQEALDASGVLQRYPEIDLDGANKLGVFAKLVKPDAVLNDYDRVEIYRPLKADPKQARKQRAENKRAPEKETVVKDEAVKDEAAGDETTGS